MTAKRKKNSNTTHHQLNRVLEYLCKNNYNVQTSKQNTEITDVFTSAVKDTLKFH